MVRIRTFVLGSVALGEIRRVASIPSSSGMRMSISTTSGRSSRVRETASAPVAASPTTRYLVAVPGSSGSRSGSAAGRRRSGLARSAVLLAGRTACRATSCQPSSSWASGSMRRRIADPLAHRVGGPPVGAVPVGQQMNIDGLGAETQAHADTGCVDPGGCRGAHSRGFGRALARSRAQAFRDRPPRSARHPGPAPGRARAGHRSDRCRAAGALTVIRAMAQDAEDATHVDQREATGVLDRVHRPFGCLRIVRAWQSAASAWTTIEATEPATAACSSRAIRERSAATASRARSSRSSASLAEVRASSRIRSR